METAVITNIFEEVKARGIPFDHHASDLYIPSNNITKGLVARYEFKVNVTSFVSQIDNQIWLEIPFAYSPFYDKIPKSPKARASSTKKVRTTMATPKAPKTPKKAPEVSVTVNLQDYKAEMPKVVNVRVALIKNPQTGLQAYANINLGNIMWVNSLRIYNGPNGICVGYPKDPVQSDDLGMGVSFYPITSELRDAITVAVLKEYNIEKAKKFPRYL